MDRVSSTALALLNYVDTLQEYIEEQFPETRPLITSAATAQSREENAVAFQAVDSIRTLLKGVRDGNPVSGPQFNRVIRESHAAFVTAGLISSDSVPSTSSPGISSATIDNPTSALCIPDWCISHLYDGLAKLSCDASNHCEE